MSGKTKAQKEKERLEKVAAERGVTVDQVIEDENKQKEVAKKIADDKEAVENKKEIDREVAEKAAGFLEEIKIKINNAKTLDDLEALQSRVYDIWADKVPAEIQELAFEKGEEINANKPPAKRVTTKENLQKDWVKVTMEEVKAAEKEKKLVGFDDKTMTALIKD